MSRLIFVVLATLSLLAAGCMSAKDPDSGEVAKGPLTLPPDLTPQQGSTTMAIPAEATASPPGSQQQNNSEAVLPEPDNVSLHWNGHERWLEVKAPPGVVWRWLEEFVKQRELELTHTDPRLGIMETAWLYSAPPVTRGLFAPSVVDRTAASVADRYLIRVERGIQQGTSEVFVAQRRVLRDQQGQWRLAEADRFLEAELMAALLADLSGDTAASPVRLQSQDDTDEPRPRMRRLDDGRSALILPDRFFTAWRRIGLALDRAGFTVVDRDRSARQYFVRYDTRAEVGPKEKGLLDTVAFWRSDIPDTVEKYRIDLSEANDDIQVTVHRFDGSPAAQGISDKILGLVEEQLN